MEENTSTNTGRLKHRSLHLFCQCLDWLWHFTSLLKKRDNKKMKRTYILFISIAILLSLITFFAFQQRYSENPPIFLYLSYLMFATMNLLSHGQLIKTAKAKPDQFITVYMGSTAIKMFLILSVLTIYLWFNKTHLFAVGIFYAGAYLLNLMIDTIILLKQINSKK